MEVNKPSEDTLTYRCYGDGGSPLLLLHGLFGSKKNWQTIARDLSEDYLVYALDLRNHGESFHHGDTSYNALAGDVLSFLDHLDIEKAVILGHSMGGKTAMRLAFSAPERITALIVEDVGPGSHGERYRAELEAMLRLDLSMIHSRGDAERELAAMEVEKGLVRFLLSNLRRNSDGAFFWRNNLDGIGRGFEEIWKSVIHDGDSFSGPTLFLKGEKSQAIDEEDLELIKQAFPRHQLRSIADAGHWIHAERYDLFLNSVRTFLRSLSESM